MLSSKLKFMVTKSNAAVLTRCSNGKRNMKLYLYLLKLAVVIAKVEKAKEGESFFLSARRHR
jgi:hypothetical protein